jgi:hypothetical protein
MRTTTIHEINTAAKNGTFNKVFPNRVSIEDSTMMTITKLDTLPKKEYIIQRLEVSPGNLILMCATGCSGKTMLAQYIATCVGGNHKLFDQFDVKSGGVVHIDAEQSEIQTRRRYIRLANGLGITYIDVLRSTLKFRFDSPEINLKDVESELVSLCEGKTMLIIDSLKAVSCADENSANIEAVLKMFKKIAEKTQCAVLCIHHKGKGKDAKQSGRGHSSIYDSCDVQFDLDVNNEIYEITCAKNREGKYFDGIKYTLLDEGDFSKEQNCTEKLVFSLLEGDVKSVKQTQKDKILGVLVENAQMKYNDLFALVKGDRNKFNEVIDAMIDSNEIKEDLGPRNSKLYSLTEDYKTTLAYK